MPNWGVELEQFEAYQRDAAFVDVGVTVILPLPPQVLGLVVATVADGEVATWL